MAKMKAVQTTKANGPFEVVERDIPEPGPDPVEPVPGPAIIPEPYPPSAPEIPQPDPVPPPQI